MEFRPLGNILLAATIAVSLGACSSGKDDDDPGIMPSDAMMSEVTDIGEGDEMSPDPNAVDLNTTPVFATASCDAAPAPETTATSVVATAPAVFLENTLVGGQLGPSADEAHYWSAELQAGIYHLVLDNGTTSGSDFSIGLTIDSLDAGGELVEQLVSTTKVDNRMRVSSILTLPAPTTLRLRISTGAGLENYLFGVFSNGTAVASPFFSDCPGLTTLALETTEAFAMGPANDPDRNEVWFETTLEDAAHTLSATATIPDGEERNIIYSARLYSQFGQDAREVDVVVTNEITNILQSTGPVQPLEAGLHWIRFRNGGPDVNATTTLSQN